MSEWLQGLNPEQCEAASHNQGPLLILAGAGSGKTTVLVARTGRLISEKLTTSDRICVLTFTNKAAQELKHRVAKKLGDVAGAVWAGTFHGFGLQFLKEYWKEAGLPKRFGIIDGGDAQSIVKELLKDHHNYDKQDFNVEKLVTKIGDYRQHQDEAKMGNQPEDEMAIILAPKYEKRLKNLGVVDFEDLLLQPLKIMKKHPEIREKMEKKFDYVMVDEFQDTNKTQMRLIDELTAGHRNIAVVGDDDQSIYGWRGAEIQNILGFPKRYANCNVVRLEQNYRSSSQILGLANAIISTNTNRHAKVLRSGNKAQGEMPELFILENEDVEVDQVVREINSFKKQGFKYKDIAILYRSNSQGGMMEGGLRKSQIPYKITGGTALFDRKEAKDILAFIRSAVYPTEVSFRRIINLPARGIGDKTIDAIEGHAEGSGFYQKTKNWIKAHPLEKVVPALESVFAFLDDLKIQLVRSTDSAEKILDMKFRELGYRRLVELSYKDAAAADGRWIGVIILGRILDGMFTKHGRSMETLEKFIDAMELRDVEDQEKEKNKDEVQMMTLHACKGLEFPLVFLLGMEEEILPHARLGSDVDEERRLFYVGVTRAQKRLIMTRTRSRKRYGRNQAVVPSRFLMELDPKLYKVMEDGRPVSAQERTALFADLMKKLEGPPKTP